MSVCVDVCRGAPDWYHKGGNIVVPFQPSVPGAYSSEFSVRQSAWLQFRDIVSKVSGMLGHDIEITFYIDVDAEVSYYWIKFCLDAGHKVMVPTFTTKKVEELDQKGNLRVNNKKTFCGFRAITE